MDKYTVDLDKVLNDFEYSELTEQGQTYTEPTDAKNRAGASKHSINNVFSSLNDYLNTDIGGRKDNNINTEETKSVNNNYTVGPSDLYNYPESKAESLPKKVENDSIKYEEVSSNDARVDVKNIISVDAYDHCSFTNPYIDVANVIIEDTKLINDAVVKIQTVNVDVDKIHEANLHTQSEIEVANSDVENEIIDSTFEEENDINLQTETVLIANLENEINEESIDKLPQTEATHVDDTNITETIPDTHSDTEVEIDIQKPHFNIETISNEQIPNNSVNNQLQNPVSIERINNNLDSVVPNNIDPKPPETAVGFQAVDIDDAELQNYLDALDDEDDEKFEDTHDNVDVIEDKPKSDEINADSSCDIEFEKCIVRNDAVLSPSERPNSLDIGNDASKRPIDLIGNPGSTPYNNLYVSKEIPTTEKSKSAPYESESSASVSPTFSEASTDSVRSSDTDSEIDPKLLSNESVKVKVPKTALILEAEAAAAAACSSGSFLTREPQPFEDIYVDINSLDRNLAETSGEGEVARGEELTENEVWLGKRAPVWIPDSDALNCMHCDMKFTVIKRRHHCRACGLVLCSKCCGLKYRLQYLDMEARVCTKCHEVLSRDSNSNSSGSEVSPAAGNSPNRQAGQPNPNNPMEYCSVVPPLQQVSGSGENPPSVMVPVGVLKRKGSNKAKHNKSVMFCDGIRPGSDLTNLDNDFNYNETRSASSAKKPQQAVVPVPKVNRNVPIMDANTKSFIPENEHCLPPTVTVFKSDITYTDCANNANVVEMLKNENLTFALQRNLQVHVRLITMDCCINKQAWCFSTEGLISVGQDEIVLLIEYIDNEKAVPKDIFYHLNNVYADAVKGTTVTELGLSMHPTTNFLDSKNHAGFIFIRPTFQCLQNVIVPKEPYLIGILVHRWETPWAKIFPLRLVLRLGAEYRYYPSPIISTRHRDSVFVEIGHTIINLLADFRNFTYTLPNIRGLTIHMEEKNTTVTIPVNRYDQVMKSISNSSDHILAFGGNFSSNADSHLVCIQDTHGNNENNYTTHAINIQNTPRKVTGASFIVFNGALKSTSGLTAKSSIVEDGLMIQIPADHMIQVRDSLKNMKNHTIQCGCVNATSDETVNIVWGDPDVNFNIGVKSSVDEQTLSGVPSIRVHNGKDYVCNSGNRLIRWTEVFLLQNGEENARTQDPVDVSKVAENISKATCQALVKYLDLLATNNFYKIGIRTTLHVENVSYSAGSNGIKLPPIYMKSLDNELVPVLHRITSNNLGDSAIILELIFRILNV